MKARRRTVVLWLLPFAFALACWHIHTLKITEPVSHDTHAPWTHVDSLPVWLGSRTLLQHRDPYSDEATRQVQVDYYGRPLTSSEARGGVNVMGFAYPPYTAFVFAWLAVLPWKAVSFIVPALALLLIAASVRLWTDDWLVLAGVMASWPVLWGLRLENVSMIIIPLIFIAAKLYLNGRFATAGFLLALATVKPQLVLLLIPYLLIRSRRNWRFLAALAGTFATLAAASEIWLPGCFAAWIGAMRYYRRYTHVAVPLFPLAAAVAVLAAFVAFHRRTELHASMALVLATTIVICPTDPWTVYNYLLLAPAALLVIGREGIFDRIATVFVALEFLLPAVVGLAELAAHGIEIFYRAPGCNFLLPVALVLALSVHHLKVRIAAPHQPV